jgi:DNA mismatch repair protein MutL
MKTKQDQEELGTQIIVEGKFVSQDMAVLPKGHLRSKISFQYSARRNFFKVGGWSTVILSMSFNVSL